MGVTKYVLKIRKGMILLLVFGEGMPAEGSAIEAVRNKTGKSLPGLRKFGARMGKANGVPLIDETN